MGSICLDTFVEHTEQYQKETDSTQQTELKNQSSRRYMAFVLLRNSDQVKYQSLTNASISQYSMENDQYTKTITAATDILANHKHDTYTMRKYDKYMKQEKQNKDVNRSIGTNETSFAQSGEIACYCCGKKGNESPQCLEKDTKPRAQWAIRKAQQHLQAEANRDDNYNDDDESIASNATRGTNTSFQRKGWSGLQVNLMNHDDHQSMQETITLDNCSTLSWLCNPEFVKHI